MGLPSQGTPAGRDPAEDAKQRVKGPGTNEDTEAGGKGPIPKDCMEILVMNLAEHGEGF